MEIIPVIVGFLFVAVGGYILFDTHNFRKISQQTIGRLIGYESHISKSRKHGSQKMYTPVVEFDCNGETYSFKGKISSGRMTYKVGNSVPVIYLENDPHNARIRTNVRYALGGIFVFIGIIALTIGIVNFRSDKISLIIAAVIIVVVMLKLIQVKARLNAKAIHTLDDIKNRATKPETVHSDPLLDGLEKHNRQVANDKNYRPSEDLITSQDEIEKRQKIPKWAPVLFMVIGIGMLAGGGYFGQQRASFLDSAMSTQGRVVSMESSTSDGSTVYYPIVRYNFPRNNQSVRFKHNVGSSHPGWRTGDTVTVLYNPRDMHDAMIDDGWMNWLGPIIITILGTIFFIIGFAVSRSMKKI